MLRDVALTLFSFFLLQKRHQQKTRRHCPKTRLRPHSLLLRHPSQFPRRLEPVDLFLRRRGKGKRETSPGRTRRCRDVPEGRRHSDRPAFASAGRVAGRPFAAGQPKFLPPTPPLEDDYSFLDNLFPDDVLQEEETPEVLVPDTPPPEEPNVGRRKTKKRHPPREFGRTRGRTSKKRKTPSYK